MIEFDAPKEQSSIIKVLGVGGGGSNAVNHMYRQGIEGVDFIICNTDAQALDASPIPNQVQLGSALTEGRGAGSIPEVGKNAAMENLDQIKELLEKDTKMLFITAGMGGGTGTGGAPVIAATAKEMGILTVAIVTLPFAFEGRKRRLQAEAGIEELRKNVDTILIISNDKLRELYGNLRLNEAFAKADDILTDAAKGIAELITVTGHINVDFEDVKTVMKDSGVAIMGTGRAEGENRALEAVEMALSSPLLNDNHITGASDILLYIASGSEEITMDEVSEMTEYIQDSAGLTAEVIWGTGIDESLGDAVSITVIATGFEMNSDVENSAKSTSNRKGNKIVHELDNDSKAEDKKSEDKKKEEDEDDSGIVLINKTDDKPADTTQTEEIPQERKFIVHTLDEEDKVDSYERNEYEISKDKISNVSELDENQQAKAKERIVRLKSLSRSFNEGEKLDEVENIPAYVRRGVKLNDTPSSEDENVSRYTLDSETGELKSNNSFLHDNVD
jgi:cell division protein FtsZ